MLEYICCFIAGAMVNWILSYLMALGHTINLMKDTQRHCAALFLISEQGLQETLQLKYLAMQEAKRSQQNITAQKYIDQMNIDSIHKSIMRNYNNAFPEKYKHVMEYTTWEEMENYVNDITKENKKEHPNDQARKKI